MRNKIQNLLLEHICVNVRFKKGRYELEKLFSIDNKLEEQSPSFMVLANLDILDN